MKRIVRAFSTPAARTSAFYYFGNFFLSFSRYLFHLVLLRLLVPSEYGEFLSYLSLLYLLSIPTGTVANVVTKFVSEFKGKGDSTSVNQFFYYLLKIISPVTIILGSLLILFSGPLAGLFKAHSMAFIILGVSVFISLFQTIINSYIIAFQKFIFQTVVGFVGVLLTIFFSVVFIKLGMGATGAVLGQLLAGTISSLILFLSIRQSIIPRVIQKNKSKFNLAGFTGYSFIFALGTASLISTDILMVRALFNSHISGIYSSLSILGRMILFGLTPLSALVLPIASHRHAQNTNTKTIFVKLGVVILSFGTIGASIFSFFPVPIITLLSGASYLEASPLLSFFAFSMAFLAFSQFILTYLMATGQPQANIFLLTATILQPVAIYFFRYSFESAVKANFALQFILFFSLTVFVYSQRLPKAKHI
jgi:O-antigen/teichoic acid export membrane protein